MTGSDAVEFEPRLDERRVAEDYCGDLSTAPTSQRLQVAQRAVGAVEYESEDVRPVLLSAADEPPQVGLVGDHQRHIALRTRHLELHVARALSRRLGQVERDVGERELERDLLVADGARAEHRKCLRRHRHRQVHRGYPLVVGHVIGRWRSSLQHK